MPDLFRRLLGVLACSTHADLRRQVQYLRAENGVLRSKIKGVVRVTPRERARLARLARPLGPSIKVLVSIARPETVLRWVREADRGRVKRKRGRRRRPGRPRTPERTRRLILRLAKETGWGYARIVGELRKLGVRVSKGTVANVLREAGLPTGPERGEATWDQFIRAHARTLWACDFLRQRTLTLRGFRDAYALAFVNVATRRAVVTTSTERPDAAWVAERVEGFQAAVGEGSTACRVLTRDRDTKFGEAFDGALRARGITPVRLPHRAPNLNAHVERFIQTVQTECLDRFLVLGTGHLDHLLAEYLEHYNLERPHSALGHRPPAGPAPPRGASAQKGPVHCRTRLGGALRHYRRAAA